MQLIICFIRHGHYPSIRGHNIMINLKTKQGENEIYLPTRQLCE